MFFENQFAGMSREKPKLENISATRFDK